MKKPKNNIGDIVYFEDYFGNIDSRVVVSIEPRSYVDDNGGVVHYFMYTVGKYEAIEDYNCIDENDPRLKDYLKKHKGLKLQSLINALTAISEKYNNEDMPIFVNDEFVSNTPAFKVGGNGDKHILNIKFGY